jgi:hypothetical protein
MSVAINQDLAQHLALPLKRRFSSPQPIPPEELFMAAFLSDGPGSFEMAVDGSVNEAIFRLTCPEGHALLIHSVTISLICKQIDLAGFGKGPPLTNGLVMHIHDKDGTHLTDLIPAMPIRTNYGFARFGETTLIEGFKNNFIMTVRWDIAKQAGFVPYLKGGQYMAIHVRDNLTNVVSRLQAVAQGRLVED